ncbi:MAG: S26 family signal peptidase [Planctomycetota bacterium]
MGDKIRAVLLYAVAILLIVGVFKLLKLYERVPIDANDHSMEPIEYPPGRSFGLTTSALKAEDYKGGDNGDVVAYFVPGKTELQRVARVLALPGEKVTIERLKPADPTSPVLVKVNGVPTNRFKPDQPEWHFPEIMVPRGCLFLMSDKPSEGEDSLKVGPVPFYCIRGKLN